MQAEAGEQSVSPTLGCLTSGPLTDEQRAAYRVADELAGTDRVHLEDLDGDRSLSSVDALWWHRDTAVATETLPDDAVEAITTYLDDGGGLLLSLHAVTAVDELEIDPHPPDLVDETFKPVHTWGQRPAGFLVRSQCLDKGVFERVDGMRIRTHPSRQEATPRIAYDRRVPKHGTVLASAVAGADDLHAENSIVGWQVGDGTVVGIGQHFVFDGLPGSYRKTVRSLLAGTVEHVVSDDTTALVRPKSGRELAHLRSTLTGGQHKPSYHFSPPANWMNDPNGLVEWNDEYHLFYQYNPAGPYHGSIHWGHAVSDDLVHWEDRPIALEPEIDGPDQDGCWSGCTVIEDGTPTFVYTGGSGRDQLPCLAYATDDTLDDWEKCDRNPVIDTPPDEPAILSNDDWNAEFRDHDVWKSEGTWYQLIGSGTEGGGGMVLLYESRDLVDWTYRGPILVGDRTADGPMWECPELLDFGDRQLLQVSNYDTVSYYLGEFDGSSFEREHAGTLDHGNYYAAQSIPAGDGHYLSWGWIREDRSPAAQWEAGWSGVMSLPRSLSLTADGSLEVRPAPEVARLRSTNVSIDERTIDGDEAVTVDPVDSDAVEIVLEFELDDADGVELTVAQSNDGEEQTPIRYFADDRLVVDREHSSSSDEANAEPHVIESVPQSDAGTVRLHVFVDASVVEVFANERTCLSSRIYPTHTDSTGISIAAIDGSVEIRSAEIWAMNPAFDDDAAATMTRPEVDLD